MGKMSKQKKKRAYSRKMTRQNKLAMVFISFIVCVLCGVLLYSGHEMKVRINQNQTRIESLQSQIEAEKERTEEIFDMKEEMQTEEYITSVAQSKLGLVKENEIIFKPEK